LNLMADCLIVFDCRSGIKRNQKEYPSRILTTSNVKPRVQEVLRDVARDTDAGSDGQLVSPPI
jgi:hypothetical protein